jgi:D-alanine transfer protein
LYGSSELTAPNPYRPAEFSQKHRTGFTVFQVGSAGTGCLLILQKLASIGPQLRGRKVAISLSPTFFFLRQNMIPQEWYAHRFSPLQAGELAWSSHLSFELRQAAARRMLDYPSTLEPDPQLRLALQSLADGSRSARAFYYAGLPAGKVRNLLLRLRDHAETVRYLKTNTPARAEIGPAAELDWNELTERAECEHQAQSDSNPFRFDNQFWRLREGFIRSQRSTGSDSRILSSIRQSREWLDLELLLRALEELGAKPLILGMPIHGRYYEFVGITAAAREVYYRKLGETVERHRFPFVDFSDHDQDPTFLVDPSSHLSGKGWVYYNRALHAFYYDTPQAPEKSVAP